MSDLNKQMIKEFANIMLNYVEANFKDFTVSAWKDGQVRVNPKNLSDWDSAIVIVVPNYNRIYIAGSELNTWEVVEGLNINNPDYFTQVSACIKSGYEAMLKKRTKMTEERLKLRNIELDNLVKEKRYPSSDWFTK